MKVTEQLIQSFFEHSCTPEEAKWVADYLIRHPEVSEKYVSTEEWQSIPEVSHQPEAFWEDQWMAIERKRTKAKKLFLKITRFAAAAMIILLAGAGIGYLFLGKSSTHNYTKQEIVQPEQKVVENSHSEVMLLTLADGSRVELLPGSRISFIENFEADKRVIDLRGEAVFQVAKDANRPFTVNSGKVNTTALGTKFRVSYYADAGNVSVQLYEGKVLVQSMLNNKIQKAFLSSGEVLTYHAADGNLVVNQNLPASGDKTRSSFAKASPTDGPEQGMTEAGKFGEQRVSVNIPTWYRFDKEWLPNVFDQLADIYHVKIIYQKEDLENKYFIGKFEQTSSLETILETIAEINDLHIEKKKATYYIIKNE